MLLDSGKDWGDPNIQWVMLPRKEKEEAIAAVYMQCEDFFQDIPYENLNAAFSKRLNQSRRHWQQRERTFRRAAPVANDVQSQHESQSIEIAALTNSAELSAAFERPSNEDAVPDELAEIMQGKKIEG